MISCHLTIIMFTLTRILFCACIWITLVAGEVSAPDTYLNALQDSHQTVANNAGKREDHTFHANQLNGYDYQPPIHQNYGPPAPIYDPPKPIYGPPAYFQAQHLPTTVFRPRDEHWFFDKFKFKLNLFTIGKILLKLLIFKKIIKFIGLICLLLFIPKLKHLMPETEDDDTASMESRSFTTTVNQVRINEINNFARTAFETFSRKYQGCERDDIWCRFQQTLNTIDQKYPYEKIVQLYLPNTKIKGTKI